MREWKDKTYLQNDLIFVIYNNLYCWKHFNYMSLVSLICKNFYYWTLFTQKKKEEEVLVSMLRAIIKKVNVITYT